MQFYKKPSRKSDGSPEFRSIDELLAHAVSEQEFATLPGKGKPLDLSQYFASGPESRIANKLLKDNAVLPQSLQDRRDAEQLHDQAQQELANQAAYLTTLKADIAARAPALSRFFSDRQSLLATLNLATWPEYLPEPTGASLPGRRTFLADAVQLAEQIIAYNRRIEVAIAQHLDPLRQANKCVERLNKSVSFSQHLPAGLQLKTVDLQAAETAARAKFTALAPLPDDLGQRLDQYYKKLRPSLWRRLWSCMNYGAIPRRLRS